MDIINLYGAGGHAKVIADIISAGGGSVGHIYDDDCTIGRFLGREVLSPAEIPLSQSLIISIGNNRIRRDIAETMNTVAFERAVHPSAVVSPSARVNAGSVIMQGAIIQADAQIGRHCIVNTGASVDHDCRISDYVHIAPHATLCGNVEVGEGTLIGAGAVVIPGVKIGKWCVIGAGSVVIADIPDNAVGFGNPFRAKI